MFEAIRNIINGLPDTISPHFEQLVEAFEVLFARLNAFFGIEKF